MIKRTSPLFYGWYVAATLSVAGFVLYGCGLYSFILFVTPLSDEFHWSRAGTGALVSAFWLTAPLVLLTDRLIRRYSVRNLVITGIVIEATCLILLFSASHLWQMYLLRATAGLGKVLYAITIPTMLSRWFSRRFGLAVALVYFGWHTGGLIFAPFAQLVIQFLGWRATSVSLGLIIVIVALPLALRVLKVPSPALLGKGIDGAPLIGEVGEGSVGRQPTLTSDERRKRKGELLRNKNFLLVSIATSVYCLAYSGVLAHQAAAVELSGISARAASFVLGSTAGFAALGALLMGWLVDRFELKWTTLWQFGFTLIGIGCLLRVTHSPSMWLLIVHAVSFGFAVGGTDVFFITALKRRIPDHLFSSAYGIWYFGTLGGMICGPWIAGLLYDMSGSYSKSLVSEAFGVIIPFVMCLLVAIQRNPAPEQPLADAR